jgi:tetratricopeptide (TPR) repeat protein
MYKLVRIPRRKKVPLKVILSHINNISKSSQIKETTEIHKPTKQKKKKTANKKLISDKELEARINKIKNYGEKLLTEGAYLEAQKQFEFAENILLKLDKKEEALVFSDLKIGIKELSEQRDDRLEMLEEVKLGNDTLKIFDTYYDIIELSEKLKDYDSADIYLSELIHFYQNEQRKLRDLEYQRFKLYKKANSLIKEKSFEQSVELYEMCEKISQILVEIGRENEKNNVKKFQEKVKECLKKASQK